jgi:hypothetical protein
MKSDLRPSEKQRPQQRGLGDELRPDKMGDAAWTFIEKIRRDDPTLVPAVESYDDHKRDGRNKVMSGEQSGSYRPDNVAEVTSDFTKSLRKSGFGPANVTVAEVGLDSSKVKNLDTAPQSSSTAAKKVHDTTKTYIDELRESGYDRPIVTLVEKDSGKQNNRGIEQAGDPTLDDIHTAARTFIRGVKQSDPKQHGSCDTLVENGSMTREPIGISERPIKRPNAMTHSSILPPPDSPLTTVFVGQYVSALMQETIAYLKLPYDKLAHEMSIPELVLRDAVEGRMRLTRGQWVKLGKILGLPTTYILRPGERDGVPCWEVCFPPVHVPMDKA